MFKALTISVFSLLLHFQLTNAIVSLTAFSDDLIDYVNSRPYTTWRAARSHRFQNVDEFRKFLGAKREPRELRLSSRPTIQHEAVNVPLPKEFDARVKWPKCETIGHIWDQSSCGSCWAFGAVGAMSDRVCIHSGQTRTNVRLSTTDLLACCKRCGDGCEGGYLGPAWDYWRASGLVTGGDFEEEGTCKPYPFPPCNHRGGESQYPDCPDELYPTPRCRRTCIPGSKLNYKKDKIRAKSSYNVPEDEEAIKREIFLNGPVEAAFDVYEDFGNYEEGVYHHVVGEMLGGHAIRIIGWGQTEDAVPYWLIANSWNEEWAEKGFFRILRGKNECGIEAEIVGGIPKV